MFFPDQFTENLNIISLIISSVQKSTAMQLYSKNMLLFYHNSKNLKKNILIVSLL